VLAGVFAQDLAGMAKATAITPAHGPNAQGVGSVVGAIQNECSFREAAGGWRVLPAEDHRRYAHARRKFELQMQTLDRGCANDERRRGMCDGDFCISARVAVVTFKNAGRRGSALVHPHSVQLWHFGGFQLELAFEEIACPHQLCEERLGRVIVACGPEALQFSLQVGESLCELIFSR
jgi:hypothetical protein